MAAWGFFVAVTLVIGSLPFFVGLAVVLPVLAHSTWHLYRKVVESDLSPRPGPLGRPTGRRYAADFPAVRAWATESVIWVDLRRRSETRRQSCIDTNAGFRRNPQNRICKEIAIQRPKIGKLDYLGLPNDSAQALAFEFFTDH
jgi:hypothetical protein